MNIPNPKSNRVLELYHEFLSGNTINKQEMAIRYNVNERSIQRDIDTIRAFLSEQLREKGIAQAIEYDRKSHGYRLITRQREFLTNGEIYSICKILVESRAYTKADLSSIIDRILRIRPETEDNPSLKKVLGNDLHSYVDPAHGYFNTEIIWEIVQAIDARKTVILTYKRLYGKETVTREVEPVGILFSEYYFYLMGKIMDSDTKSHFDKENDPYPTIYRVDRIEQLNITNRTYSVSYSDRFKEGEYKNRNQFMYGGELQSIKFKYTGPSVEAVLDRLPLSNVVKESDGSYTICSEVFGTGIKMWLLSQGKKVQVLEPQQLVSDIKKEIEDLKTIYDNISDRKGQNSLGRE